MTAALRLPGLLPRTAVPAAHPRSEMPHARATEDLRRVGLVADARTWPSDPLAWLSLSTNLRDTHLSDRIA